METFPSGPFSTATADESGRWHSGATIVECNLIFGETKTKKRIRKRSARRWIKWFDFFLADDLCQLFD